PTNTPTATDTPAPTSTPTSTPTATHTPSPTPSPTSAGQVVLAVVPVTTTVGVGETFSITLETRAGTQLVDGASAYLNFDPTVLQVVTVTAGSALPVVLQNDVDNGAGQVNFVAGVEISNPNYPSGTFTLATVTFRATAGSAGTPLVFNVAMPRKSDVTASGLGSVLDRTENGTVVIGTSLVGSVTLQGRPAPPDPSWSVPLSLSLTLSGESVPAYEFTPTTDESGTCTVSGIAPGTYQAQVKNGHTLQNTQTVTLTAGANNIDFGTLREGDANNDNYVTLLDFSILATTFGKGQGAPGYDDRADFNGDGFVTLLDFSLLATNFGQAGDTLQGSPLQVKSTQRLSSSGIFDDDVLTQAGPVVLAIVPLTTTVNAGDTFDIAVEVRAGAQQVDSVGAYLDFNPTLLQAKSITPGPVTVADLPLGFANSLDNVNGHADFARGVAVTDPTYPSGTFILATFTFTATAESAGTPISFQLADPRRSIATFGGFSVLDHTQAGTVTTCYNLDGIGGVDTADLQLVAGRWRLPAENPDYNVRFDVVYDEIIDIRDIMTVVDHWGQQCP
ncbi:MAG: cohesin domain-containing protein, partial [Anaerolineae bacterium]